MGVETGNLFDDEIEEPESVGEEQPFAPHYGPDEEGHMVKTVTEREWKEIKRRQHEEGQRALEKVRPTLPWNREKNKS